MENSAEHHWGFSASAITAMLFMVTDITNITPSARPDRRLTSLTSPLNGYRHPNSGLNLDVSRS